MAGFFEEIVPRIGFGRSRQEIEDAASLGQAPGFRGPTVPGAHIDKPIHSEGTYRTSERFGPGPSLAGGVLREAIQGLQSTAKGNPFFSPPSLLTLGEEGAPDPEGFDVEDLFANVQGAKAAAEESGLGLLLAALTGKKSLGEAIEGLRFQPGLANIDPATVILSLIDLPATKVQQQLKAVRR